MTAFQPIRDLASVEVVGVEALTRFVCSPLRSPDQWFREAEAVGRGTDLEFLALETALRAAADLPEHLYVGVNLSPRACLDPRLSEAIRRSRMKPRRIVVELTEHSVVANYADLMAALASLREDGLRLAIDDACNGFSSLRHVAMLSPEMIKLDRTISAGIDTNPNLRALCCVGRWRGKPWPRGRVHCEPGRAARWSGLRIRLLQASSTANGFIMAASGDVGGCFPWNVLEAWYWAINHVSPSLRTTRDS